MSDCINGCLTDTFNYINDVCGQLTFALYTLFTFFFFASKLTGWTEPTFTLYVVFVVVFVVFFDLLPNTDNTTSHISFHFHIHYFRRALPVPSVVSFRFSSFFTCDRDGQLSTVKLRACVWGNVVNFHCFLLSVRPGATKKQMMTLTAVKLSLFDFIINNSGQASLIIE